jgi:alkylhydroperoxidase family enzyme
MSYLSKVGRSQAAGAIRESFEKRIAERGNIPNMFRVMAHRPELYLTMDAHFKAVMAATTLSSAFKEMLAVQTSLANGCVY